MNELCMMTSFKNSGAAHQQGLVEAASAIRAGAAAHHGSEHALC